jgi:glycosyltransferase involved in cell wall biosynthesis
VGGPRDVSRLALVRSLQATLFEDPERIPDVIHTHLLGSDFWTAVVRQCSSVPRPPRCVSTAHNVDRDDSSFRRFARRWAVRRADRVAAISDDVQKYVTEDLAVPGSRVTIIPNGADLSRVIDRGDRAFRGTPMILMVGRLERQKGHDIAFRALANVHAPWKLDVVGEGSRMRELKELAERIGISSRVHFRGARSDVPQLLADADLFLFPSRWEGFGIALAEAAAAGVPLLASNLPALRDFIPQTRLVASEDVTAWQREISAVLADPASSLAAASHLAPRIRKRYDVEGMVDRYVELYRGLL